MSPDNSPAAMANAPFRSFLSRIYRGYAVVFRSITLIVVLITATIGVAVAAVYPLWYAAKYARGGYTAIVGLTLLILAILVPTRRLYTTIRQARHNELPAGFFLRKLRTIITVVAMLALAYSVAVLAYRGNFVAAIIVALILFVSIGVFASRRNGTHAGSA